MNQKTKSYLMIILAMLIYGTTGVFRKLICFSSPFLATLRGAIGTLFLIAFCLITKKKLINHITKKELILLILSGALIGLNWVFLFQSYNYTSVPVATLCYYMEPTFVIFISPFLLKEKLNLKKLICAFLAIIGMVFVSGVIESGGIDLNQIKGVLFALGGAAIYAAVVVLNKKTPNVDQYEKTTIQLASTLIAVIPYWLISEDFSAFTIDTKSVILTIVLGIVNTGLAYTLFFGSMKGLNGQSVAILSYIDPLFSLLLSAIVLKEYLTLLSTLGAILIIGSALVSEINFSHFRSKKKIP